MLRPQWAGRPARRPLQRLVTSAGGQPTGMAARTARPWAAAIHTAGRVARTPRIAERSREGGARSVHTTTTTRIPARLPARAGPTQQTCPWDRIPRLSSSSSPLALSGRRFFSETRAARDPAAAARTTTTTQDLPRLDKIVALVDGAKENLLGHTGIPSEEETATALRICADAADLIMDTAVQPQLSSIDHQADTAASALLSLDNGQAARTAEGSQSATATRAASSTATARGASGGGESKAAEAGGPATATSPGSQPRFREVVGRLSDAALAMIDDPRVVITPALLEQYVHIQARLGRPETLPHVLHQYTSKETPKLVGGGDGDGAQTIAYAAPASAASPSKAVAPAVAEAALNTALAAQNLDAAVGIIGYTYATPAFERHKLLRRGLLPGFIVFGLPAATYMLAGRLAQMQTTMDDALFTNVAFAAILVYIACTGTIGVVANATANDQMKRVTWAPGTPLRERWLREEERAALDRVACAFGFSDELRYGEEEGPEFQALREYIRGKGMLVDQTELLEGMND